MEQLFLVLPGTPAAVDVELDSVACSIRCGSAEGTKQSRVKVGHRRNVVIEDRRAVRDGNVGLARCTLMIATRAICRAECCRAQCCRLR
jgi:hypothetical protein